ncbi:bifunctional 4-hydroxy-2-oxoglutarate aldolase/2-dehydro-3-deoxy-phosphogluconate aldolase [Spongiibacter sp.]|uniref:bifunctional 4-hydroxy-2-oxoglutarate aldolase/2-dehydro-3-deoxy-phosphogluconate aldolase n=1 Tax=Spongiibacter sp. TaxID=2024860 RepID=UPI0035642B76
MHQLLSDIVGRAAVLPVLSIDRVEAAIPLAIALRDGGLPVLEVTLRTPAAIEAIDRIRQRVSGVCVGAGTVISGHDVKRAKAAGSEFLVAPGCSEGLLAAALDSDLPFMPGVATASEAMRCLERGLRILKFFPAEASGGAAVLHALAGPLPMLSFCPTGGISLDNMAPYLALPSVVTLGASWVAPPALQAAGDWSAITERAQLASRRVQALRAAAEAGDGR